MALDHETAIRDTFANAVDDACNVSFPGSLVFQTSGDVEVATLVLADTAFGPSSSGVITAGTINEDADATGGTVAKFKFEDGSGTPARVFGGTVTATGGGGDIELSSLSITATDKVSMTSFTYTACA